MTLNQQIKTIKNNWLIVAALVVLLLFSSVGNVVTPLQKVSGGYGVAQDYAVSESAARGSYYPSPIYDDGFAPDVEERQITKSSYLSTEVERGEFDASVSQTKSILASADAIVLNEQVSKQGSDRNDYRTAYFSFKVDTTNYDSVVSQLRNIGEVQSFNENANDITGTFESLETRLEAERARLARFEAMQAQADEVADQIELTDRMFEIERAIQLLEKQLENQEDRVSYSTVSLSIQEKQSSFANISFITFGELVRNFVNNINSVLSLLFSIIPWLVLAAIIYTIYRVRKH